MKKSMIKTAAGAVSAVKTAENIMHSKKGNGTWKCVAFLLIGIISGYLLSPAKGGVLIGSFNGAHTSFTPRFSFSKKHRHKGNSPFPGSIIIGSFNGSKFDSSVNEESNYDDLQA